MSEFDDNVGAAHPVPRRAYRAWLAAGILVSVVVTVLWMVAGVPSPSHLSTTAPRLVTPEQRSSTATAVAAGAVSLEPSGTEGAADSTEQGEVSLDGTALVSADDVGLRAAVPPPVGVPSAAPTVSVTPPPSLAPTVAPPASRPATGTYTPPTPEPPAGSEWVPGFGRGKGNGWGHFK